MKTLWHIIFILALLVSTNSFAQDLTVFEVVDNLSVGLTEAPYSKWGMAVSDIDRNGYPDIFCVRWKSPGFSRIYINDGGHFQDITNQSPIESIESDNDNNNTRTVVWVDFDNDGDRDISFGTNTELHLLRNDNNVFMEVSEEMGFVGQVPPGWGITQYQYHVGGWADYDFDGDLDCIVSQYNNVNLYLFRNDGDHFTNVASEMDLDSTNLAEGGWARTVTWTDFDHDGDPDLFSGRTNSAHFYRNDNGVFVDVTEEIGLAGFQDVRQREFFDYDNDGDLDFINAAGPAGSENVTTLFENQDGIFVDVNPDVGLTLEGDNYASMTIGDFDNDGDQDIFLSLNVDQSPDVLLINDEVTPGDRAFADVAEFVGITKTGDRKGCAFFDNDVDGLLDVYLPSAGFNHLLYHNLGGNQANWIGFILEGTLSNRDAVGSLITLYHGEKKQLRYTKCGSDFQRQDNPWVHFGIGFDTGIDSVVIRWPLGYKQVLTNVAINQYHEIKEPDYTAVEPKKLNTAKPSDFRLEQNYPNPFNPNTRISYHLSKTGYVRLEVYSIQGQQILSLVDAYQNAGSHIIEFNADQLSVGIYIYRLSTEENIEAKKMLLVK